MRCLAVCQDELVIRMLDEILLPGFEVEFIVENRPLARRLHDAGVTVTAGDPAPHRHLPQGRHRPLDLRHHRGQRQAQPEENPGGGARRRRRAGLRARGRHRRDRPARRRVPRRVPRRRLPLDVGAVRRAAAHRVQPLDDAGAGAAVSALLQRRRARADHAAQRSRSRRHGQRPGAAQRAAPHQDHGHHRRDPGGDASGKPADGRTCSTSTSRRSPRTRSRNTTASRWSTSSRTTSAA